MATIIPQLGITFTSATAVLLTQSTMPKRRKIACLFGLAGEPFWVWSTVEAHQWGILALVALYTFLWGKGFYQYYIRGVAP